MLANPAFTGASLPSEQLRLLVLLEATRVTGVARNAIEYARLAAVGTGGVPVGPTIALIRRGEASAWQTDRVRDHARAAGLHVEVLVERHRYDVRLVDALRELAAGTAPDIIETHHIKSHCLLALSKLWREYPWVAFHHGYTQTDVKVRAYNQVDRWSLRHAAHVVTTNEPFAAALAARGVAAGRITVLHNGVRDEPAHAPAVALLRDTLGLADDDRVVLAVGRLSKEKGQQYLVRAARQWRGRARLVIVGDGPERPALEHLAAESGGGVIFAGLSHDVAPYYGLADVFVLPSLSEGSPNVLLEAMVRGLPVVATAVGGVPEIATDGVSALLGPSRDPDFIGRAVVRLLDDRALAGRLGTHARRAVLKRYTPEQRATTLSRLYGLVAGRTVTPSAT
jgi:glycosyltransferase involved in cell wall biosynthesis